MEVVTSSAEKILSGKWKTNQQVWAIGTGEVAGPGEIVEAHAVVRETLMSHLPAIVAPAPAKQF